MSTQFYYAPMTSATRIHWAIEETGIPYEKVKLDLSKGEQKKPDYLALNPNGKVPLLVDDGTPIFESLAILIYLGERYGVDKGLFPSAWPARAETLKWMCWAGSTLFDPLARILRNTSERFPADEKNPKALEGAMTELASVLRILDDALARREYLVGEGFSLADLSIAAFVPFMGRLNVDLNPFKNINAWSAKCIARPALGRAMMG